MTGLVAPQLTKVKVENAPEEYIGQDRSGLEAVIRQFFGYELGRHDKLVTLVSDADPFVLISDDAEAFDGLPGERAEMTLSSVIDQVMKWLGSLEAPHRFRMLPQSHGDLAIVCVTT